MFDDLRQDSNSEYEEAQTTDAPKAAAPAAKKRTKKLFGMTGPQRFVLSFMFSIMVCVIGFMALLITGKVAF